jgi:hypothetical protein
LFPRRDAVPGEARVVRGKPKGDPTVNFDSNADTNGASGPATSIVPGFVFGPSIHPSFSLPENKGWDRCLDYADKFTLGRSGTPANIGIIRRSA